MVLPGVTSDAAVALGRLGLGSLPPLLRALSGRPADTRHQLAQLLGPNVSAPTAVIIVVARVIRYIVRD